MLSFRNRKILDTSVHAGVSFFLNFIATLKEGTKHDDNS